MKDLEHIQITDGGTETIKQQFYKRYDNVPAERVAKLLLADVLMVGEAERFDADQYEWACDYAERFLNVVRD